MSGIFSANEVLAEVNSEQELEGFLRTFWRERSAKNPIIFYSTEEGWFHVGISKEWGFLNYHDKDDDPPYFTTVGCREMKPEERIEPFYLLGVRSEIPFRNCVPTTLLIEVLKEYFRTGLLSDLVAWEPD